jgi:hypothetical protein
MGEKPGKAWIHADLLFTFWVEKGIIGCPKSSPTQENSACPNVLKKPFRFYFGIID